MPNNLIFIVLDSCRYDSLVRARTPNMDRLGPTGERWSYASWTAPSHYAFLMGLLPHASPQGVFASEVYKQEFAQWVPRLGIPDLSFKTFVPELSLPKVLRNHGYRCTARVSLPVINQFTLVNKHFDDYALMANHNDFGGMIQQVRFDGGQPQFYFFNLGETHYPYMLSDDTLPHISGVHGVLKHLGDSVSAKVESEERFFDMAQMRRLHDQQANCVEHVDRLLGTLFDKCPENTHFIVTADHGELFGEGGYFGHGPIMHEMCFRVPFVEGTLR
jgi:arylsulfatase A-like enzyme